MIHDRWLGHTYKSYDIQASCIDGKVYALPCAHNTCSVYYFYFIQVYIIIIIIIIIITIVIIYRCGLASHNEHNCMIS